PVIGYWTSTDPAMQFDNLYAYAGNGFNPINFIDPDGRVLITGKGVATGLIYLSAKHPNLMNKILTRGESVIVGGVRFSNATADRVSRILAAFKDFAVGYDPSGLIFDDANPSPAKVGGWVATNIDRRDAMWENRSAILHDIVELDRQLYNFVYSGMDFLNTYNPLMFYFKNNPEPDGNVEIDFDRYRQLND
ncbi:hypothetical protein QA601_17820, partial [Chitinispirillales bacterium ANBcel5]|uniref:hypothetical protein n=1 Tax=Cellulosispirillum alkaliphilum TaxID=3039283 RepID=UPI002A4F5415|nr:hypothetical protein [Chitinispirillales bacterium ANBcel5]